MKVRTFLACSMAIAALAACNKNNRESGSAPAENDKIIVTTANPPPGGTWADVVNETSAGGFVMATPTPR